MRRRLPRDRQAYAGTPCPGFSALAAIIYNNPWGGWARNSVGFILIPRRRGSLCSSATMIASSEDIGGRDGREYDAEDPGEVVKGLFGEAVWIMKRPGRSNSFRAFKEYDSLNRLFHRPEAIIEAYSFFNMTKVTAP